jgi:uncharacterized protein with NRDE domain
MCTVSFVRAGDSVIITSNRDEHIQRKNAAAPALHEVQDKKIIFPKDAKAGGTWFAAAGNGTVAVLLNGAFVKHIPSPPYRRSRGLIVLDIVAENDPLLFFTGKLELEKIEPFTLVLFQSGVLHELRWDGYNKYERLLDDTGNYIWSSATLYTDEVIGRRKDLFDRFIENGQNISATRVQQFHSGNGGDEENGFVINRQTGMKTFSITQAVVKPATIDFIHTDLLQQRHFETTLPIQQATIQL